MRLIDSDTIKWHTQLSAMGNGRYEYVHIAYETDIDAMPTMEPERKYGHWIDASDESPYYYICSECGTGSDWEDHFCRECGSKMEGAEQWD